MLRASSRKLLAPFTSIVHAIISFALVYALASGVTTQLAAEDLATPRKGLVQNVPLATPWNGCLLVRDGPNTNSTILGHVINGTFVQVEATEGAWYKISSPMTGYVYGTYVRFVDPETPSTGQGNPTIAVPLEELVLKAEPWTRVKMLEERRRLLEQNDTASSSGMPSGR
ncbi:MAG TPA: SH3 domain-containing protein [Candidatus Ozemobacteraceae bacterium]|nr:SH3 domain-containing protein [Candidatus Ozemobacteraceae bacterium]